MKKSENNIVLFSVMLCWASAYVFIKSLPEELGNFGYLALMNGIAAVLLLVVFCGRLKKLNRSNILHGFTLAVLMMLVLIFEKEGIERLSASSASILTSLDIVLVPLFMVFLRKFPKKAQVIGAVFVMAGIIVTNGFSIRDFPLEGSLFMLGDCLCMSLYTVVSNRFCQDDDPILLAVNQIVLMALLSMIGWHFEDPAMFFGLTYTKKFLSAIFMLAFFTKAYAYIMLMYGEKYGDPINVVLIFAMEPVATLMLSVFIPESFGGVEETFTKTALIGAVLIMIGSSIANLEWDQILPQKKRKDGAAES